MVSATRLTQDTSVSHLDVNVGNAAQQILTLSVSLVPAHQEIDGAGSWTQARGPELVDPMLGALASI